MTMDARIGDPPDLGKSIAYCRRITQSQAKNFYYALRLLPEPKRSAMFVLYAYMRLVDDIADAEDGRAAQQRSEQLDVFQQQTRAALAGQLPDERCPLWPAFVDMVHRCRMPGELFDEMIAGQRQDLHPLRVRCFDELRQYCYRVASIVGLASIRIWGYEGGQQTERLAIDRGIAFQLTNILRDLREDCARGRMYLPQEELAAHGVDEHDVLAGRADSRFLALMRFQIDRAESYYRSSSGLEDRIECDCRPALITMTSIYHGVLRKIARDPLRVLRGRVSLSLFSKILIGLQARCAVRQCRARRGG